MPLRLTVALTALAFAAAVPAFAQSPSPAPAPAQPAAPSGSAQVPGYPAVTVLSTGTTVAGEPIRYAQDGNAHVTATIITLAPGARGALHKHGVPMFAYILDGEITVDYGPKGKRTYKKGDALMEAMDVAHFGQNTGTEPMRLIAVYMGSDRAQDVIPVH